jgi:hypothetical protein
VRLENSGLQRADTAQTRDGFLKSCIPAEPENGMKAAHTYQKEIELK